MREGRVLITGPTGFVGRRLVDVLASEGRALTLAMRRRPVDRPASSEMRVVEVGEIGGTTDWTAALEDISAVVHLAAHVHVAPERAGAQANLFEEVNVAGSSRLFAEILRAGVPLFVLVSSITVLGPESAPGSELTDDSAPAPDTPYARSKLAAEMELGALARAGATRLVILRPPLICGPGVKGNLATLARIAALPLPPPLGGIPNRRTLLSVDNLACAISTVLDRPVAGTYVLGDARPLSTSDIVRHLREGAGRSTYLAPLPVSFARWAAGCLGFSGHAQRLLGDLAIDSSGFRRAYGWSDVIDTAASLRATGSG